jgi:hypothetical protein
MQLEDVTVDTTSLRSARPDSGPRAGDVVASAA